MKNHATKNKIIIAIDGHSSTGKSTVARRLAKHLGYVYVNTGAMYWSVTLYGMRLGLISKDHFDKEGLIAVLKDINIRFEVSPISNLAEVVLNGENVEKEIRTLAVSSFVSPVATIHQVRTKLVEQQQQMGKDKGIVMDGRDIGTVVFPNATLKLFMTATAKDRAERRYKELLERGDEVSYEAVLKNVVDRDHIDSTRKDSPLRKASDAMKIDNSNMTLDEQFDYILSFAEKAISKANS